MRKYLPIIFLTVIFYFFSVKVYAQAKVPKKVNGTGAVFDTPPLTNPTICATSGNDGTTNINGSINTYFPPKGNLTLPAGTNSITLGAVPATDAHGNNFGSTPIKAGDLLLIIQMQDATINYSNTTLYGANSATSGYDALGGTGFTSIGNSGKFEYIIATNDVPLTGGVLNFKGSGTSYGTVYTYTNAAPTATRGQRSFQIIRLPQYANLRLSSNISPPPFNGSAGGIIAFSVAGKMDFNGYTIDVSGRGFRGGYSLIKVTTGVNINSLYVANSDDNRVSGKGEGIAGTPRYMWDGYNQVDNIVEGLPGGSGGRGAPGNAGGGGNDVNSGGGGGGNGGSGGVGGWGYEIDPGTFPNGGRPGSVDYSGTVDDTRLIMGGGGGGGHANDALTGVKGGVGGGIVIINATTIIGTGSILANGTDGQPGAYGGHPDGSGGGAAGGTIFVKVATPDPTAVLTMNAIGGRGGNTQNDDPATTGVQPHGPGGGGGGGLIYYAIASGTINVNNAGGASGKTNNGAGITHNAAGGSTGISTPFAIGSLPPYLQGNTGICYPQLITTMAVTNPGVPVLPGAVVNYVVKIMNTATDGSAGGVEANISLPLAVSFISATVSYTGTASGPAIVTNAGTPALLSLGDFNISPGDAVILNIAAKVNCVTSGTYNSSAQAIYLDPTRDYTQPDRRITAATNAFAGANTTYQTTKAGPVPGSNYNGGNATDEDVTVVNNSIANNNITAPATVSFCSAGGSANIIGSTPTGGTGAYTYQWQSSTDGISFTDIPGATGNDYAPPVLNTIIYYLRRVTSGTCAIPLNSNVISIKVLSQPAAPAPFTRSVCPGSTATLTLADAQTGITYNWYDSATKNNLLFTGTTYVTGLISANTTYYVEADNGSCPAIALTSVQVNVNPVPAAPAVTTPVVACDGSTAVLKVTNPQAGLTYNWYTVATGGTSVATGSTISETAAAPNTTYYVEAVNSTGCVSARTDVDITIIPIPSAPVVQAPATICSGSPVTLTISNPLAGITYNWYDAATDGMLLTSGTQFNTLPLTNNTTYYVEAVNNTAGCTSARTAVQVNVNQIPSAPAPFSLSVCPGGVATLTITDAKAGITYNWYDSATKANLLFTGTSYVTNAINTNTTYYIEAVNGSCPAVSLATVQVNVVPPPAAPAIIKNPLETCANNAVTININNPQAGLTYNWYTTSTSGTPIATGSSYLTPALTAGTTYYAEAVNAGGCASPRTTVDIVVDPQPDISAKGASVCPNTAATVTASSTSPNVTINWYANATGGTILATGNSFPAPAVSSNTNYYAEAVNTVTGCISASRAVATVAVLQQLAAPVVSVDGTTSSSITFKWDAVTGATGYLVSIDNGATYTSPSSGSNGVTHTIAGLQEGQTITILVEATGASDCQLSGSSTAVTAIAHDDKNDIIYIANAFTPNGDGKNDVVYVHSNNIKSMIFYVYDQLGEMIFRSTDVSVGWDGTYKGVKQPVGVYVYFVQAVMNDGQHLLKKGTITLLR